MNFPPLKSREPTWAEVQEQRRVERLLQRFEDERIYYSWGQR